MSSAQITVVFDGICNLCDATVNHLQRYDRAGLLRFIPFQGDEGADLLRRHGVTTAPDSVYVATPEGAFYSEDLAMVFLFKVVGGWHKPLAYLIQAVPRAVRRPAYRWMSKNRYVIFGKRETCRL